MNILEHDSSSDGKFYHEYSSRSISPRGVSRTGRSDDEIIVSTGATTTSSSSSTSSSSIVHTGFNGLGQQLEESYQDETPPTKLCDNNSSSEVVESRSSDSGTNNNIGTATGGDEQVVRELGHHRMESSDPATSLIADSITEDSQGEQIRDHESNSTNNNASAIFTCENCGKAEYRNGEFETIKLGDIFTHLTQFPSSSEGTHEGPRLCAQCLANSHIPGGSTTSHHNIRNQASVINNLSSNSSSNNHILSRNQDALVVTNTSIVGPENKILNSSGSSDKGDGEGSGQLLQGVPTIIMQNATNQLPSSQEQQYQHYQQHQYTIQQKPTLISPPTSHPSQQEMHHDHQQQHFYQQQQGHILQQQIKLESADTMGHLQQQPQQIKLETDSMGHLQQQQPQPIKMENESVTHAQQQAHPHEDFMLIHDGGMYNPDSNDNLHLQHPTMVTFYHQPDTDLQQQHRQQVICDNQQQQQHHQPAGIQQITVVTPGSDIKYTIPSSAVMQIQGKDQGGIDQGQGGQPNHLESLSQQQHTPATLTFTAPPGATVIPTNFQFIDLSAIENPTKEVTAATTMITTVVTHTSSTSSITTTPSSTITTTSNTNNHNKSSGNKSRSNASNNNNSKSNNSTTASGSGGGGATKSKKNNANTPQQPTEKIPCDLCKKKFKNPKMAMNHYKRVHEKEARFVCEICGAVFSYRESLDSHLASHKPPEKTHDCEKCGMKFSVKSNLRQHMRIHSDNPKKFPCDFCVSGFSKRVNLRYHIKRKHPEEAEKMNNNNNSNNSKDGGIAAGNIASAITGAITNSVNNASGGVGGGGGSGADKDNKNQGSFKCEHCDRAFLFKNNLKAHLRTHTRDKKYTCELCGKSFIYKESLKNHMLLHSNELPYLCDICGKKFRDRSNRRKHVKNVHKYLFVNGDINNPLKPGSTTPAAAGSSSATAVTATGQQPGEPPTKKRKTSKKAAAAAAAAAATAQPADGPQTGQDGSSSSAANANKARTIIKSPAAPRGKKKNAATTAVAGVSPGTVPGAASNTKSVIVTASTTTVGVDRKIIMSPCPKPPKAGAAATMSSSPNSLEYMIPHSHPSLPVTVHVPPAGSQAQFSHGRSIIVKASSSSSPPALSPEMYHQHSQHQQHGGRASMQQNVIVYPKRDKVISDHSQYPSSSTVISQTMQQQAQHQYYANHDQHHQPPPPPPPSQGYTYLPPQQQIMPPHISSPNPGAFEYVLSTNQQDGRGGDLPQHHPPYGSSTGPPSQPMEIQVVSQQEYTHHLYPATDQLYDYQWPTSGGGHPHPPPPPPNPSSPYHHLVAPPVGSNGSSSGIVNEGPQHPPPPVSLAQTYDSSGMGPTSNASVYGTSPQGYEVLDPSGNGGNFFCKDFDFSYL